MRFTLPLVAGVALATPSFGAEITPASQFRTVEVDVNAIFSPEQEQEIGSVASRDFGPFDAVSAGEALTSESHATMQAVQVSSIDFCEIAAAGGGSGFGQSGASGAIGYALGFSTCVITFTTNEPANFRLSGSASADPDSQVLVIFQYSGAPSAFQITVTGDSLDLNEWFALEAGTHTLTITATTTTAGLNGTSDSSDCAYDLRLTSCGADVNGDGAVDFADLLEVIGAWGPCPGGPLPCRADTDGDGDVALSDLLNVLASWGS